MSLIISKYETEARHVHLCGYISTYICHASMCTHTHTYMCVYILCTQNYLCTWDSFKLHNSRSKIKSSQVSEVFGPQPGFQHIKKWVLFKFKNPFKAQTFPTSNLSQPGNEIWALQTRQGHMKNTGTSCLYQDGTGRWHSNKELRLLLV